jgi:cellulose synthase/poly-beta-1,6-N-acetylglucosamine synthase-like glycosyltransferase
MIEWILWAIAAGYVLAVAAWWYGWFYQGRVRSATLELPPVTAWPDTTPAPSLAIIVACHNEAHSIEACATRLLRQQYPHTEIILANDRSTDRTGAIIDQLAAAQPNVRAVHIDHLPAGWTGKTHAVHTAVQQSTADYVLFIDSDVELEPHTLVTVMHKVVQERLDFLSLWPHLELRSFWERLLTPPVMTLLGVWAVPARPSERVAEEALLGNGQFMLVRRAAYEAIGGHADVGAELAEDAILAIKAHDAGQRCWSGPGRGLYVTFRDGDLHRTVNALARVLIGSLQTQQRLLIATQILLGGMVAPAWVLPAAIVLFALNFYPQIMLVFAILAVLHTIGMTLVLRRTFDTMLARRGTLLWFPIGALCCVPIVIWAAYLRSGQGRIRWGSTDYRVSGTRVVPILSDS